ncbi:hypothetical protein PHYPSEUDO_007864 [Phytophthora pseudosyringae]|uniref:Uncharacterized protein n=1 Tax=Phytophthora pseudosyringae TaxID=221518 RepID=A0A8T1VFZ0_9STRA|nr:hypothetical protein PHYPSEUDO_007864 [Phytophthora pseudosyringae]
MEGLRKEILFGPTAPDHVNVVANADLSDSESDVDDEDVMEDNAVAPVLVEGADGVTDVPENDDVPDDEPFDLTDGLPVIEESGWVTYDEENSGDLQIDAATDHYDGQY